MKKKKLNFFPLFLARKSLPSCYIPNDFTFYLFLLSTAVFLSFSILSFLYKAWCITGYIYVPSLHSHRAWLVFLSFTGWYAWKPFKCPLVTQTHSKFMAHYSNHEYLMEPVIAIMWMGWVVGIKLSHFNFWFPCCCDRHWKISQATYCLQTIG